MGPVLSVRSVPRYDIVTPVQNMLTKPILPSNRSFEFRFRPALPLAWLFDVAPMLPEFLGTDRGFSNCRPGLSDTGCSFTFILWRQQCIPVLANSLIVLEQPIVNNFGWKVGKLGVIKPDGPRSASCSIGFGGHSSNACRPAVSACTGYQNTINGKVAGRIPQSAVTSSTTAGMQKHHMRHLVSHDED